MKKLPIGLSDFKELIEENYYYFDKTNFIDEVIKDVRSKSLGTSSAFPIPTPTCPLPSPTTTRALNLKFLLLHLKSYLKSFQLREKYLNHLQKLWYPDAY